MLSVTEQRFALLAFMSAKILKTCPSFVFNDGRPEGQGKRHNIGGKRRRSALPHSKWSFETPPPLPHRVWSSETLALESLTRSLLSLENLPPLPRSTRNFELSPPIPRQVSSSKIFLSGPLSGSVLSSATFSVDPLHYFYTTSRTALSHCNRPL